MAVVTLSRSSGWSPATHIQKGDLPARIGNANHNRRLISHIPEPGFTGPERVFCQFPFGDILGQRH
jgi:hypothetical protein